ncbi:hypothetical protein D3C85_1671340 [compost metagenome]
MVAFIISIPKRQRPNGFGLENRLKISANIFSVCNLEKDKEKEPDLVASPLRIGI